MNRLRHKIGDLRHVLIQTGLEIVAISQTELAEEFPVGQFFIDRYSFPPYRHYTNQHGIGLMVFTRKDITKRLSDLEVSSNEMICIELSL